MTAVRTVPLGDIATVERSSVQPANIRPGTLYVGLEDIESGGDILGSRPVDPGDLASTKFSFTESHVLYGKLRPYLAKIAAPDFAGICSTDIVPVLPGPHLDRRYLLHFLRQPSMVAFATARSVGINLPRLSPAVLETFPVPLPPLPEQQRIAAILDQVDALRAKRRMAHAQLEALRDSVVDQDLSRFESRESLGDHLVFVTSGSRGWAKYYSERGSRFIRSQDVLLGSVDNSDPAFVSPPSNSETKRTAIRPGDLLITITGTVGRVAAAPAELDGAFISQHVAIARPGATLRSRFAESYLCSREGQVQLERAQYGQTKPGLNLTQIRAFMLPVPDLAAQDALVCRLQRLDNCREQFSRSDEELESLFSSLQYRAFRGEL